MSVIDVIGLTIFLYLFFDDYSVSTREKETLQRLDFLIEEAQKPVKQEPPKQEPLYRFQDYE